MRELAEAGAELMDFSGVILRHTYILNFGEVVAGGPESCQTLILFDLFWGK